jgi:hypothetical protein
MATDDIDFNSSSLIARIVGRMRADFQSRHRRSPMFSWRVCKRRANINKDPTEPGASTFEDPIRISPPEKLDAQ